MFPDWPLTVIGDGYGVASPGVVHGAVQLPSGIEIVVRLSKADAPATTPRTEMASEAPSTRRVRRRREAFIRSPFSSLTPKRLRAHRTTLGAARNPGEKRTYLVLRADAPAQR